MTINLPISLTLIRLIISPVILPMLLVWFLPNAGVTVHYLLAGFFALLSITDFLDGYLARRYKQVTKIGALLDPMADKFLVFSTLIALLALGKIYFFWVIIFIGREFFVLGFRIAALERGFSIPVDWFGKLKTVAQTGYLFFAIARINETAMFENIEQGCLYAALTLTVLSGFHYYKVFSSRWFLFFLPLHMLAISGMLDLQRVTSERAYTIDMKFNTIADYFQNIEQESSRIGMTKLLAELFESAKPHEAEILAYLSLGLLRPPYKGFQFNLAEKNLIPVVAQVMDKTESYVTSHAKKIGDLGSVLDDFEHKPSHDLTLLEVYKKLEEIEAISGAGSVDDKINATVDLLRHLDPVSGKYIIRIILGTLRLGFSDMTVIDALSWMVTGDKSLHDPIEHAYNISADIGLIAKTIKDGGIDAIKKMHINLGVPIRPAAAERMPTAKEIIKKLGPCVAQPKLDGFRLQVHLDKRNKKPIIHFFSRNLLDMSSMFPDLLKAVEDFDVETLIVEGEAIAYDPNTGTFLPFQETVKRKRKHGIEEAKAEYPLVLSLFDILYLNGESLLDLTHEERRKKLHDIFKGCTDQSVRFIEEKKIETPKELEDYFNENIASGLEGLVVKKPDAVYQPGKRNFNWIKLKREEVGHIEDTIDCVVLGYYAGSGKRASFGIGAFLIAVYNKKHDHFESIAKIGTGLKDEGWKELKKKLDAIKTDHMPKNVAVAKELYPDVWVYPEIVCRIRADEITLSPLHTAGKKDGVPGYALRFPRFMDYRSDKSAEDATEVSEIVRMYEDQFKKS